MVVERYANLSSEMTEGRRNARAKEERAERIGWTVKNRRRKEGWDLSSAF